ncbi:MAG: terminase family protein [Bacteroidota bacterium]
MKAVADDIVPKGAHVDAEGELRKFVPDAILLPYQQEWVADTSGLKVCEKSRRIGISWAEAADAALHASRAKGSDVFYIAYNQDMTRQFIVDCAWWAKWYGIAAEAITEDTIEEVLESGDTKSIKVFEIQFASGHKIQALSSKPRNLRSKQGRVIFDEFGFHDTPGELLKAAVALRIWGADIRVISTHNGVDSEFNKLIDEIRSGKRPGTVHRFTFEDAVEQGLYKRICLVKGWEWTAAAETEWKDQIYAEYGDDAAEELDVVPNKSSGKYFSRVLVQARMDMNAPVVRLKLDDAFAQLPESVRTARIRAWCDTELAPLIAQMDPDRKTVAGEDFGRVADLTFLLVAQITPMLIRKSAFAVELRNVPFEAQKQIVLYVLSKVPRFVAASFDKGGNGAYLAEVAMQRFGKSRIHEVQLSAAWYLENFPRYRSAIYGAEVTLPADDDLLDDHGDVEFVAGVPRVPAGKKRKGTADGLPRHADGAVAAVMMWHASLNQGAPIEFQSLGPQAGSAAMDRYVGNSTSTGAQFTDVGFGTVAGGPSLRNFH